MRFRCTLVLVICCFAILPCFALLPGQSGSPKDTSTTGTTTAAALPSTETLPRNYPVITVHGICSAPARPAGKSSADCKTIVTRADFEKLVNALNPAMPKYERHQLAENYANILALSHEAIKRGLDKDPRVQEKLRFARLRALAGEVSTDIYEESMRTPESEAERYYEQHKAEFRRYTLQRVFIPQEKQGEAQLSEEARQQGKTEMHAMAEKIQVRAAAGEDFDKLQKEVMAVASIKGDSNVDLKEISRRGLPEGHQQVLDLAPGTISSLVSDDSGYYVYRLVSSEIPRFEDIRQQLMVEVQSKKQNQAFRNIQKAAQLEVNDAYFDKYEPPKVKEQESEVEDD
jgi:hypothetical protein